MASSGVPVVTGYYRYTDIWYEWHQALPEPSDRAPVKAILAHDALTHPDHPLHPGKQGIEMHLGIFESGEARLLFSSKQVDYVRYWLHAMKLTKSLVPLPYSDCLLTEANLRTVTPIMYKDGPELRNALKEIDKNNKRLKKGTDARLTGRRHVFERVRQLWREKIGVWCAIDIEAWERDSTVLTEFGWGLISWDADGACVEDQGHLINEYAVKRGMTNGTYVDENRYNYNFGESQILKQADFVAAIHKLFTQLRQHQRIFLVFHDNDHDLKDLGKMQVNLEGLTHLIPDTMPPLGRGTDIFVIDTSDLIGALLGDPGGNKKGLSSTCNLLQIRTEYLHNAGNDAHYTLLVMRAMAEGDPVDMQREKRWPNQTPSGMQVQVEPWQEDYDYSDEEGIFGFIDPAAQTTAAEKKAEEEEKPKAT